MIKTYHELSRLKTFEERFQYLKLDGVVGVDVFGGSRYLNQKFYKSDEWKSVRRKIILRDNGCDLGVDGYEIHDKIIIHHINPLTVDDIRDASDYLLNPENLICVTQATHNAIHYGKEANIPNQITDRQMNDTCPWKN